MRFRIAVKQLTGLDKDNHNVIRSYGPEFINDQAPRRAETRKRKD